MQDRELLSNTEAAEFIGVSPATLTTWRCTGRYRVPYLKIGRSIRYLRADLSDWLASRRVVHPQGREVSCR